MTDAPAPLLCPSIGYLIVGGKQVGLLKCQLVEGHNAPRAVVRGETLAELMIPEAMVMPDDTVLRTMPGTGHAATLTWEDDAGIDWPEALDPAETFDTDVELDLPDDFGEDTEPIPGVDYDDDPDAEEPRR